jgi:cyanate lyase
MPVNTFTDVNSLSAADKERLRSVIVTLNDSMTRADAERDMQKEQIVAIADALNLDKKLVRRMAKTYYRANYNDEVENNDTFEKFYSAVLVTTTV